MRLMHKSTQTVGDGINWIIRVYYMLSGSIILSKNIKRRMDNPFDINYKSVAELVVDK